MLDRQTEALYYPQPLLQTQPIRSVLCLAPHPDDEVFGCGGLLALLAAQGTQIHTLILSQGEQGALGTTPGLRSQRVQESQQAATILNLPPPEFGEFPDRGLVYAEPLIARITQALEESKPQYLLLPALSEPHPDHQALALAGIAAAQRSRQTDALLFYEVGAPLHPNCYLDITSVAPLKWQAVQAFASQLGMQTYEDHARAFASLRAYGLGADCTAAEAFFQVSVDALRQQGAAAALPYWPMVRSQQGLANATQQLPLVSVLIRSVDRPQLAHAVASVATQTYSHIEIVVLNASGHAHSAVGYPPQRLALHLVNPSGPCGRSQAANAALDAAHGDIALFLDDDDLLAPTHVERLVQALAQHPRAVAAYSGVRVEADGGAYVRTYDLPWSRYRLNAINFLPIHAVAFSLLQVRQANLHFDENLPVLEDWDFWRRVAALGDMVHCPGVTALYRQGHGESGLGDPEHVNYWKHWHTQLIERFVDASKPGEITDTLVWHAIELDRIQARHDALRDQEQSLQHTITAQEEQLTALHVSLQTVHGQLQQFSLESQASLQTKQIELERYSRECESALKAKQDQLESFSRESQWALKDKQLQLDQFAKDSQGALHAKQIQMDQFARDSQAALQANQDQLKNFSRESQMALQAKQSIIESFSRESQAALQLKQEQLDHLSLQSQTALATLQQSQTTVFSQQALLSTLQAELLSAQSELRTVSGSLSWRITAPLRRVGAWLKRRR
jgi:LmbE family N-acetylglucosaminyl deacetylase/GT2 family glycosyltransferase